MKKLSVRTKYALALVAILVVLMGSQLAVNRLLVPRFYLNQKLDRIEEIRLSVLDFIEKCGSAETLDDAELSLTTMCEAAGVDAMIMKMSGGMPVIVFSNSLEQVGGPGRLFDFMRGKQNQDMIKLYAEGEDYSTYLIKDSFTGTDQIDCVGFVVADAVSADAVTAPGSEPASKPEGEAAPPDKRDETRPGGSPLQSPLSFGANGYYYVLSVAIAEITETAEIYNKLMLRVGLVTAVVGGIIMYLISGSLTKPIKQMTSLSRKMADMDFSERYTGDRGDEIQTLGDNMNEMATKLETAIANLKDANAKLAKDISEKDETARQRRELLSNISHELKTPIAVIQGYAEGLKEGISEDPDMRDRYCTVIMDEAGKMNRLVMQLLSLDELESEGKTRVRERFDLAEMLRGEANVFLLRSQKENISLQVEVPETLPVLSDDYLWEQVLQNYLSNAFHHVSAEGTVRVSGEKIGDGVRITVFNTGEAIPEASMEKLWDKFYKVDKARTRAYGGSGIGLSIVKAAMDNLGGTCAARNTEGGVEFIADLPGCAADA